MSSVIERIETKPIMQPRYAFDIALAEKRRQEVYSQIPDQYEARQTVLSGLALDWQGFAWEYGLKKELRFTPFVNTFHQRVFNHDGELEFRMVAEEDAATGEDFLPSLDPTENRGLVYQGFKNLKTDFINSDVGDSFFWASPKNANFSEYSFAYYGRVEHSLYGKTLRIWNYYNDLSHQELSRVMNTVAGEPAINPAAPLDEVATTIVKNRLIKDPADVWSIMASTRPDRTIAGAHLDQILSSNNPRLLAAVKERSYIEATSLLTELESGTSIHRIQELVGDRLLRFVSELTGQTSEETRRQISRNGSAEGSCGSVSFGSHGPIDAVVSEISPLGVKRCKFCKKSLRFNEAYCMNCKFC